MTFKGIIPGTTKHMYAALRAVIPDLRRSVAIRTRYFNNDGEHIVIPSNGIPAVRYVGMKLFMTKLWCGSSPAGLKMNLLAEKIRIAYQRGMSPQDYKVEG